MKKRIVLLGITIIMVLSCVEEINYKTEIPIGNQSTFQEGKVFEKNNKDKNQILVYGDTVLHFVIEFINPIEKTLNVSLNSKTELNDIVQKYNDFKAGNMNFAKDYTLLSSENFAFSGFSLKTGDITAEATLEIKDLDMSHAYGDYILPLSFNIGQKKFLYMVFIRKDAPFVPLNSQNKKPMPPGGFNCSNRTDPMKLVAYVETNDYDIRNYGQLILSESEMPIFDIVVLFAANMGYDPINKRRTLLFNDKLQPIIKNPEKYIKPLTDRGIKVIIDILPHHQGVGYANFQSYEDALEFASELKYWTDKLGIDGWDIDEEWADYHIRPELPEKGQQSFMWYARAMKEVMPDKLLTLFDYGHSYDAVYVDELGKKAIDYFDYSWANYNEDQGSSIDIAKEQHGINSVEANFGTMGMESSALSNLEQCYGLFMIFNINPSNFQQAHFINQINKVTQAFYGENCKFVGKYHKGFKM